MHEPESPRLACKLKRQVGVGCLRQPVQPRQIPGHVGMIRDRALGIAPRSVGDPEEAPFDTGM